MKPFRNIDSPTTFLKLALFAGLMAMSAMWGLGLDSFLQDDGEKMSLFTDADGFDVEDKETDPQGDVLDFDSFALHFLVSETLAPKTDLSFRKASISFDTLPALPKYLLYHHLKLDC